MANYISKDELIKYPIRRNHCYKDANAHFINGIESVFEYVDILPIADVAPAIHGCWIGEQNDECSNCHQRTKWFYENYCPLCGAKMDGEIEYD